MVSDPLICDVNGCDEPAHVRVYPTNGRTDHFALRCHDCYEYDVERDHFTEWRQKIEQRGER